MSKISFPVIAHNTEKHYGFGSALPQKNRILPPGSNLGTTDVDFGSDGPAWMMPNIFEKICSFFKKR